MELAEQLVELAEVFTEVLTEVTVELITELIAELKAQVEIRQLKELKVFNSLRLSIVVAAEILAEVKASLVVYCLDSSIS